jgi:hypothetical protein
MENTAGLLFMSFNRAAFPVLQFPYQKGTAPSPDGAMLKNRAGF